MTRAALVALSPWLTAVLTAVGVMLTTAVWRRRALAAGLTAVGLLASAGLLVIPWRMGPVDVTTLLRIDRFACVFSGLWLFAAAVVALLLHDYWQRRAETLEDVEDQPREAPLQAEESYILLLLATLGALVLSMSVHFASAFLGLEMLSVPLYVLAAYSRGDRRSTEAGIKYLVLSGASSAILLFGLALVFSAWGTLALDELAVRMPEGRAERLLVPVGLCLALVGVGFKLSLVPFHAWAPDVYQGAPAPVAAFLATVSKGAVIVVALRFAMVLRPVPSVVGLAAGVAVASMIVGNLLGLWQRNLKRLLAYSSIAHMGYLLVALVAGGAAAPLAVAFYLAAYTVTTLTAFGVIGALSSGARDADDVADYEGLAWRRPWLALALVMALLSLAGLPLTAGFMGKFMVVAVGVGSGLWVLALALAINSGVGLFYYLRVIVAICRPLPAGVPVRTHAGNAPAAVLALLLLLVLLVALGVHPSPVISLAQAMMR